MDSKPKALSDFSQKAKPKRVIRSVERQCSRALSDDELLMVSAAGEAHTPQDKEQAVDPVGAIMVLEGEEP